jgi:hypothetical protein
MPQPLGAQDTLGTRKACEQAFVNHIRHGHHIIVDRCRGSARMALHGPL